MSETVSLQNLARRVRISEDCHLLTHIRKRDFAIQPVEITSSHESFLRSIILVDRCGNSRFLRG